MPRDPRQLPAIERVRDSVGERVVSITVVRISPRDIRAHAASHGQLATQLDPPVACAAGIAIVEPRCGDLIRNQLTLNVRLENGDGVCEPSGKGAACANLVVPGMLWLETGVESARARWRIREL